MLKTGTKVVNRKGLNHVIGTDGTPLRFKPWLGDSVSFLYDFIMKSSIFPKKFAADVTRHHEILSQELKDKVSFVGPEDFFYADLSGPDEGPGSCQIDVVYAG